jgi:type I restriction enzyme S subunit
MNLDTFFKKFDEFAEAPNAVQKMRELILELAVRGKLVEQDNRDAPASTLLKESLAERARLVSDHKIKERSSVIIVPEDHFYELPRSWEWARLSDVGHELGQKVPDKRFIYIDVGSIDSEHGCISDRVEILEPNEAPSRARKLIDKGTVIYSTVRPYLQNSAIISKDFDPEPIASTAFGILHPFAGVDNRYLFYWLRSAPFTAYVQTSMKGMAYPAINDEAFYSALIPLPPLAEQKRIVAKVDELMALCDRLEAQEAERKEKKRRLSWAAIARFAEKPTVGNLGLVFHKAFDVDPAELRKVILELAVRGKLVTQNPMDEPAEKLLLSIMKTPKRTALNRSMKGNNNKSDVAGPFKLPPGWAWSRFPNLGEFGRGKSKHRPRNDPSLFLNGEFPFVQTGDIARANGTIQTYTALYNTNGLAQSKLWPSGTLCITIAANIADSGILGFDACFPDSVVGFIPASRIPSVRYFEYFIRTAKEHLKEFAPSTAQKNINLKILESVLVPVPPEAEQKRIVVKVNELMALVDALEVELANSRALAERLLDAAIATVIENAQQQGAGQVFPQTSVANEELREAFLIARIVSKASDPDYPIGRFRRTKFSYLAHRRAGDDVTKHYIKKAAGPYSPWAKFDGPEKMARARGYVRDTKADPLEGMVAGECVGEVEEQVTDPLIGEAVDWVMKNFHFETNENLELLTTVDFAAVGLRKEDKEISREAVKKVIAKNKEWASKLGRGLFSDEKIDGALKRLAGVFPEMYGK